MKIALLTIWHEKNYGAELQAYATIKILQSLGHKVEMIDTRLSDAKQKNYKGKILDFISSLGPENRKFNKFWSKYIPKTRRYKLLSELQNEPPIADAYIVGSDQVWNPDITKKFSMLYFLDFAPDNILKVSYASSFGSEKWQHKDCFERVNKLLHRFKYVSCREASGVKILQEQFHIEAEHVLDPTLLFENYMELTGPLKELKTLVYYPLSEDPELEDYSINLAKRLGLSPVNNNKTSILFNRIIWNRIAIEEWVRNIAQSRFVITRSFHGLVFSLLYKKQFAILPSRNGRVDRLVSLLEIIGLSDRLYANVEELDKDKPWERKIDYERVSIILKDERGKSISYLKQSLK